MSDSSDISVASITSSDKPSLEPIYRELKNEGNNSVNGIIQLLQKSQIIDNCDESREMVRKMFERAPNETDIEFNHFKAVVIKLATKLELLKIGRRLRKAERQLRRAERDISRAIMNTSRVLSKSLEEERRIRYSRSNTNQAGR